MQTTTTSVSSEVRDAAVGDAEVVRLALVALLCEGHILLEDVPGLGKTTLAAARGLVGARIGGHDGLHEQVAADERALPRRALAAEDLLAVAAALLCLGGFGAVVYGAGPGETEMLEAVPDPPAELTEVERARRFAESVARAGEPVIVLESDIADRLFGTDNPIAWAPARVGTPFARLVRHN